MVLLPGLAGALLHRNDRKQLWLLDKERRCNEVERLFRRVKAWRRVFTRYDQMFAAFITVAFISKVLRLS
jgi:transposase